MSSQLAVSVPSQITLLNDVSLPEDVKAALATLLKRVPHQLEKPNSLANSLLGTSLTVTFGDESSLRFYGDKVEVTVLVEGDLFGTETSQQVVKWLPTIIRGLEESGILTPLYYIGLKEAGLTIVQISDSKLAELPENTVFPDGFETREDALEHIKNIDLDELAKENPLTAVYMKTIVNTIDDYLAEG